MITDHVLSGLRPPGIQYLWKLRYVQYTEGQRIQNVLPGISEISRQDMLA